MCRLAAYIGPTLSLRHFLNDPPHSLIKQSWAPREMQEAVLNADGFGIGWYTDEDKIATYKNVQPIWSDVNLDSLALSLSSRIWLANVRSATPGQATSLENTQPFVDDPVLYLHNGYIENFNPDIRARFHEYLTPAVQASINGNTDSEYLFAIVRQQYATNNSGLDTILTKALSDFTTLLGDGTALLNFILCDGEKLYIVRHAINTQCPTLYYTSQEKTYPNAALVASECLTDPTCWQEVPEHSVLVLVAQQDPEIVSL